jgi:transforming growth factor-beta-induced protein
MFTRFRFIAAVAAVAAVFCTSLTRAADIVDTAVSAGQFKTLVTAVKAADLVETLKGEGPFTVFAPTDEAFAEIPEETLNSLLKPANKSQLQSVLLYHVVPGEVGSDAVVKVGGAETANGQRIDIAVEDGTVMVDGAKVVKTDIRCDNGVIHVIDAVILPQSKTIPEVAKEAGQFSTLLAAAKAAGLVEALSGDDPLTVFAPTDEAFAALPEGAVANLLKPENKQQLKSILTYHVMPGRVYSDKAIEAGSAKTLQGGAVNISVDGDEAMVNNATLLKTDIDAVNGVIHVIDKVLMPQSDTRSSSSPKRTVR